VIWPEPSGEGIAAGNEAVDSELAGVTEGGELVDSWELEGWADDSTVVTGGTERAG